MSLGIPKLAVAPIPSHMEQADFRNQLLKQQPWYSEISYLDDTYTDLSLLWDEMGSEPGNETVLCKKTEPKLRELTQGLSTLTASVSHLIPFKQIVAKAQHDLDVATIYVRASDHSLGVLYQSRALAKVHSVLDSITRFSNRPPRERFASFTDKKAYGYDISGDISEGSGEIANRENQENLNDTGSPSKHHETAPNPANLTRDTDADKEFPELAEQKNNKVIWPPRIR